MWKLEVEAVASATLFSQTLLSENKLPSGLTSGVTALPSGLASLLLCEFFEIGFGGERHPHLYFSVRWRFAKKKIPSLILEGSCGRMRRAPHPPSSLLFFFWQR